MTYYCEHCGEEVERSDINHLMKHNKCGTEVYEISNKNYAAYGPTGVPPKEG